MGAPRSSRYDTILRLASGGMATVWVGTVHGALGFRQLVAIKKPHPHLLEDPSYRNELVAEARLASLIHHANVVDVRDVEVDGAEISLVMDYIEGASLGELVVAAAKRGTHLPPRVAVRIALDALAGLHAAHELIDERGRHVGLVHRDISPQNIVVGIDGLARVADFGVAKFARKNLESSEGSLKGKLAYMAPEYLCGETIDRRFDVFALGIVLWEVLAGRRLFRGANEAETIRNLLEHQPESLATAAPAAAALDGVIATALARSVDERFQNAQAMAAALESSALAAGLCGGHTEVITTLKELVGGSIEERRALIRAKLANEPSVASLMGVPPLVAELVQAASETSPSTVGLSAATLAGHHAEASATNATLPLATEPPATPTLPERTVVPSTLPMTPRMEGAPAAPAQRTLSSAGPSHAPSAPLPNVGAPTLASARPSSDPSLAVRHAPAVSADTQLSFNDPSARTAHELEPAPVLPRSKLLPALAGVAVALVASVSVALLATRGPGPTTSTDPPPPIAAPSDDEGQGRGALATPSAPSASSLPATAASSEAPTDEPTTAKAMAAPAPTATVRRPGALKGTRAASAPTSSSPSVVPAPLVSATGKKPPPNPYANE